MDFLSLVKNYGQLYSSLLGINLNKKEEINKWFLASILFGCPIRESSAIKTYKCFEKYGVLRGEKILKTGWQGLVNILDEGGYTRYDFKTADKLLEVFGNLKKYYNSDINNLKESSSNQKDLENKIKNLGKGIGSITVNIFLRELRGIWNVSPPLGKFTILAAKNLGLIKAKNVLNELEKVWERNKIKGYDFRNFEVALLRIGKNFCGKKKCKICEFNKYCKNSFF